MGHVLQICNDLVNVGDQLAPIITARMFGVKVIKVFKSLPCEYSGRPVLAGLGSFLGYYSDWPLFVWGTGFEPGYMDRYAREIFGVVRTWKYYAVRGYITRTVMKLDNNVVIGDPAILMPIIYNPQKAPAAKIRYFLHCENNDSPSLGDSVELVSSQIDPFEAIDLIVASEFVFTEALHIAILAYAYGIPWAWSLNKHIRGIVKWYDWFSSLGIEGRCFSYLSLADAQQWYQLSYKSFNKLDPKSLINVFPQEVIID